MVKRVAFADDSKDSDTGSDNVIIHNMVKRVAFSDAPEYRRKKARKDPIQPFNLAGLPAEVRLEVYKQFAGPDTQHGKHTLRLYISGSDDPPQWSKGKPEHSQLPGAAFLEATTTSMQWNEEQQVAARIIWSSVILQIDMSTMTSSYGANPEQQDRVWNEIVHNTPVEYIPHLRFCHFDALFYFIRPASRVIWPDNDPLLGLSVCPEQNEASSWRSHFTGVRTIEVICNHPMLPSTHDEAKVLEVLKLMSSDIPFNRNVLAISDLAGSLREQLPKLEQFVLRSRRNYYFVDLETTEDGRIAFKLNRTERSINVCGCMGCYWRPDAIC
ncbi:hypothetical protein AMS68_003567 [Peltaster fructicola]|uniref:Uncharacterized protein n=1 Tax=Peltaster fructicola TaxID=286661 RepID=A0A6H0XUC2_9PEZI|nr:hypothetical protein AMS68_003567 [Peltaster fructicola]